MNKSVKKGLIYLSLGITLSVSSYLIFYIENKHDVYKPDPQEISQKIAEKEVILNRSIDEIVQILNEHATEFEQADNIIYFNKIDPIHEPEFILLIYRNDTLKYWTDNSIPIPTVINDSTVSDNKIIKLSNGWYDKIEKTTSSHTIIGLIRLKDSYYFENQYLQNKFVIEPEIPGSYLISDKPISIGQNVESQTGDYLFSLIPAGFAYKDRCSDFQIILFLAGIILLLIGAHLFINAFSSSRLSYLYSLLFSALFLAVVYSIYWFEIPRFIFYSDLFSNHSLINKPVIPAPGSFLLLSLSLFFLISNAFKIIPIERFTEKRASKKTLIFNLFYTCCFVVLSLFFFWINRKLETYVLNDGFAFNITNILEIQARDIILHTAIAGLFASFIILSDLFIKLFLRISNLLSIFIPLFISMAVCIFAMSSELLKITPLELTFLFAFFIIIAIIRHQKNDYNYFNGMLILLILSIFAVWSENNYENLKRKNKMLVGIERLSGEKDEMAERFLKEIDLRLNADTGLVSILTNITPNQDIQVFDYLKRKYFYGFWEKYDLEIVICGNTDLFRAENQASNCEGYYNEIFDSIGIKIDHTGFRFIQNNSGKITYTGTVLVDQSIDERNLQLYITLSEKLTSKLQGYPELLIDKSSFYKTGYEEYSYAKYSNGVLAVKYGDYTYEMTDKLFRGNILNEYFFEHENYLHAVKNQSEGRTFILSQKIKSTFDYIISIAYLFVIYNILLIISIFLINYKFILSRFKFDFKNQIRYSMIGILAISFLLFGFGTIYYTIRQNKKTNNKAMVEKVQSVLIELKHKLQDEKTLTPSWHSDKFDHLDELLIKFSEVFFADINLYDLNGNLLATSRSEIFNRGLTGNQMNSIAYKMMAIDKKTEFVQQENIGYLEFASVYVPLQNIENKTIAFINLPYFTENSNLQKSISDVLIAVINFYVILFLVSVFLALLISTQITRPLRMLQNKLKSVQLGKKQQEIIYNKEDEIGELVKEYNLMIKKLESSAEKLAESERESAWREMAKQIAHEIKNPLTPMKLSIQLLQKTWFDKSGDKKDFENRLNRVAETLIEQINTLSSIASEFSAFAKMPKTRNEEVEIAKKLKTVVGLFENTKHIEIDLIINNNEDLKIIGDKEQISRVFINLIKNAIQAIPPKQKGKIEIRLERIKNRARITIKDDGEGIPEDKKDRLFEPSFTTKTTGMGIGLAIVKNIIESAGGEISFESEPGKGTSFFLEFLIP